MKMPGLFAQVIVAILLGVALGQLAPDVAVKMQLLGDVFIKLIKMLIAPVIFCTIVSGVSNMGDMGQAGRVGIKALGFFFVVSAIALLLGLVVANVAKPGAGVAVSASAAASPDVPGGTGMPHSVADFVMRIIPDTIVGAFVGGEILQVLLVALLFAAALMVCGKETAKLKSLIEEVAHALFAIIGFVMKLAPLGTFGAMAATVGHYGIASLIPLGKLLLTFYFTCFIFIFPVLALMLRWTGLGLWSFLVYLKDEIVIVFGTSSSETVLPRLLDKLEALGCERSVVGMVLPTGYSFNLAGTAIYLTLAAIFLSQATDNPLSLHEQLILLGVMMLSSKGAAGVTGAGFVVLASSIGMVGHIPAASLALILGVDRFMSQGRALTNLVGNSVVTVVLAKWEGALDLPKAKAILKGTRKATLESAT
ncbi:MAG: C4-dicarboxylate transporter DctA [Alphaproteobacteria bacterium]